MGCKSCKKNDVSGLYSSPKERLFSNNLNKSLLDDIGGSSMGENIVLIMLAWIPLVVGYFTIIKFLISLF